MRQRNPGRTQSPASYCQTEAGTCRRAPLNGQVPCLAPCPGARLAAGQESLDLKRAYDRAAFNSRDGRNLEWLRVVTPTRFGVVMRPSDAATWKPCVTRCLPPIFSGTREAEIRPLGSTRALTQCWVFSRESFN